MKNNRNNKSAGWPIFAIVLVAMTMATGLALAEPSIVWIGPDYPTDINADGTVVVGNRGNGTYDVFRWTAESGVVDLGQSTSQTIGGGAGTPDVSDDGLHVSAAVVNADSTYQTQGIWTKGIGWRYAFPPIPPEGGLLDASVASAWGLSGDGTTITGFYWRPGHGGPSGTGSAHANTWSWDDSTFTAYPADDVNCRGNDTNFDGTIVVGWSERFDGVWAPTIWENGGFVKLNTNGLSCQAEGISKDEQIVYGASLDTTTNQCAATIWVRDGLGGWTEQILGNLPGTFPEVGYVTCNDISEDNTVIVGYNQFSRSSHTAFVWTLDEGLMSAEDFFTARGVVLPVGYDYANVVAVSDNGNVFTGFAWDKSTFPYTAHGFVITLNNVSAVSQAPAYRGVAMEANYPNPFNPTTAIPLVLENDAAVTLTIFDARGRVVRVLHDGALSAGRHEMIWDGRDGTGRKTSSGVYMARVSDDEGLVDSRRMLMVK